MMNPLASRITPTARRTIALRTRGRRHGPVTRLVSPSDLGGLIKPFVFLDLFDADPAEAPRFGWHPHSGIATLTLLLQGQSAYEETTGVKGVLAAGAVEWMQAGGGVWHTSGIVGTDRILGLQLWVALPPALENAAAVSRYLAAAEVPSDGPARVVLGRLGAAVSPIGAPSDMNYLDVRLGAGERWRYEPPAGHTVAWIAVYRGRLTGPDAIAAGELAVFDDGAAAIDLEAAEATGFVLGSAVPHPHDLVMGYYSVHTTQRALAAGEAEIERLGASLYAAGKLRAG